MRIFYERLIPEPPEVVFPWIAEPEKAMMWQKEVKGGEIIVEKLEVVGTTFIEVIEEDGNQLEISGTITKYVADKTIGFHLESKIHELDVIYTLEEIEAKTKIRIDLAIRWKFPMNIISFLSGKRIETSLVKKLESETHELVKLCQTESPHLLNDSSRTTLKIF